MFQQIYFIDVFSDVSSVTTLIIKELLLDQNFIFTNIAIFIKP